MSESDEGQHTIRLIVTGEKSPQANNTFVSIVAFLVLGNQPEGDIRMLINNDWIYPELTWGNYMKDPICVANGYTNRVHLRLTDYDPE